MSAVAIKKPFLLDFERPLVTLREQIAELESKTDKSCSENLSSLKEQMQELTNKIYASLTPFQRLQIARHPDRPYTSDYVRLLGNDWLELHGDRAGHDDKALMAGLLTLEPNLNVLVIGNEKGRGMKEKQARNFGMPQPWGYRKAIRLFAHANKFKLPVLCLIDTPGAYPGLEAEANGQSIAIAQSIQQAFGLGVPIVACITGEGGSGGALAIGVADRVLMLEHSVYSVISPEGCAAILWRSRDQSEKAANALRISAGQLLDLGLIDRVIAEPLGGAHRDLAVIASSLKSALVQEFRSLLAIDPAELLELRSAKFRAYGNFTR